MGALSADVIRRTSGPQSAIGADTQPAAADTYYAGAIVIWDTTNDRISVAGSSSTQRVAGIVMEQQTVATNGDDLKFERPTWVDFEVTDSTTAAALVGDRIAASNDNDIAALTAGAGNIAIGVCVAAHGARARVVLDYLGIPQ